MNDESIQATAENLRADFLNATTTHARWKVLNRAIEWAVTASENAARDRQKAQIDEHRCSALADVNGNVVAEGDEVGWGDDEDGWIVRRVYSNGTVVISPRDSSSATEEWAVSTQDLWI